MAYDRQARRAQKHHPDLPALTRPRAEPGRERLAVPASNLALEHHLRKLRRHRRRRLPRMAKAHRPARTDHINRNAKMGPHQSALMTVGSLYKAAASSFLFVVMVAISVKRSMVLFGVRGMTVGAIIRGLLLISVRPAQCIKRRV